MILRPILYLAWIWYVLGSIDYSKDSIAATILIGVLYIPAMTEFLWWGIKRDLILKDCTHTTQVQEPPSDSQ